MHSNCTRSCPYNESNKSILSTLFCIVHSINKTAFNDIILFLYPIIAITLGANLKYTWTSITQLVTLDTITIEPNDPGRQKTVSINIGGHLLYYSVHYQKLTTFTYLGISFLNNYYSPEVTGAIGKIK